MGANDEIFDGVVQHQINILRVEAGMRQEVLGTLESLQEKLAQEVAGSDFAKQTAHRKQRLTALLNQTNGTIDKTYGILQANHGKNLAELAGIEATAMANIVNGSVGADIMSVGMSATQAETIAGTIMIDGRFPKEFWADQSEKLKGKFLGQMREGMLRGEGIDQLSRRVRGTAAAGYKDGIMVVSKREADALVRTSVQTAANTAKLKTFEQNKDVIKGITWVSTFDDRTTVICISLNGLQWSIPDYKPVGHDKVFPGPTAHWGCRSTQIPVTHSWKDLANKKKAAMKLPDKEGTGTIEDIIKAKAKKAGMSDEQIAKIKTRTKASMDGQIAKSTTFDEWLKGKPDDFVDGLLGKQRAKLWREGKITLRDLTDQNDRPLTLQELKEIVQNHGKAPKPPVDLQDGLTLAERKLLEESMQAGTVGDETLLHFLDETGERITIKGTSPTAANLEAVDKLQGDVTILFNTLEPDGAPTLQQTKLFLANKKAKKMKLVDPHGSVIEITKEELGGYTIDQADILHDAMKYGSGTPAERYVKAAKQDPTLFAMKHKAGTVQQKTETFLTKFDDLTQKPAPFVDWEQHAIDQAKKEAEEAAKAAEEAAKAAAAAKAKEAALAAENAAAKAEIEAVLANPEGKQLLAKNLKKISKEQSLEPKDLLSQAKLAAAADQKKASDAAALSQAKKKILEGKAPTPAQQKVIDAMEDTEKENWLGAIKDAKAAKEAMEQAEAEIAEAIANQTSLAPFLQGTSGENAIEHLKAAKAASLQAFKAAEKKAEDTLQSYQLLAASDETEQGILAGLAKQPKPEGKTAQAWLKELEVEAAGKWKTATQIANNELSDMMLLYGDSPEAIKMIKLTKPTDGNPVQWVKWAKPAVQDAEDKAQIALEAIANGNDPVNKALKQHLLEIPDKATKPYSQILHEGKKAFEDAEKKAAAEIATLLKSVEDEDVQLVDIVYENLKPGIPKQTVLAVSKAELEDKLKKEAALLAQKAAEEAEIKKAQEQAQKAQKAQEVQEVQKGITAPLPEAKETSVKGVGASNLSFLYGSDLKSASGTDAQKALFKEWMNKTSGQQIVFHSKDGKLLGAIAYDETETALTIQAISGIEPGGENAALKHAIAKAVKDGKGIEGKVQKEGADFLKELGADVDDLGQFKLGADKLVEMEAKLNPKPAAAAAAAAPEPQVTLDISGWTPAQSAAAYGGDIAKSKAPLQSKKAFGDTINNTSAQKKVVIYGKDELPVGAVAYDEGKTGFYLYNIGGIGPGGTRKALVHFLEAAAKEDKDIFGEGILEHQITFFKANGIDVDGGGNFYLKSDQAKDVLAQIKAKDAAEKAAFAAPPAPTPSAKVRPSMTEGEAAEIIFDAIQHPEGKQLLVKELNKLEHSGLTSVEKLEKAKKAAAEKQAAASKAATLSGLKKNLVAGKQGTPAQLKAYNLLTEAEQVNFDSAVKDAITSKSGFETAQKAAKAAQEAAEAAAKAKTPVGAAKAAKAATSAAKQAQPNALPEVSNLQKIKSLPGSTHPDLMKDASTGKQWVMKSTGAGLEPDHLRSEALTDQLYRIGGAPTPLSAIVETPEGVVKLAEFLEGGQTYAQWLQSASAAEKAAMKSQIQKHFVQDALFANWDVAGLANDNLFIVKGIAYRIDNGGGLTYRAQGGLKTNFGSVVQELDSLRNPGVNRITADLFGDIEPDEINRQIEEIVALKQEFLAAIPDKKVRDIVESRIDWLEKQLPKAPKKPTLAPVVPQEAKGLVNEDTAKRAIKARSNGVSVLGDREDIEDLSMQVWQEKNVTGKPITKVWLKVTPEGSQKIEQEIAPALAKAEAPTSFATQNTSNVHPKDTVWQDILKAAKTIGAHAADGQYNAATMAKFDQAKDVVAKMLKNPDTKEMGKHYQDAIATLEGHLAKKTAPKIGDVVQFHYTPAAPKAAVAGAEYNYKITRTKQEFKLKKIDRGYAQELSQTQITDSGTGASEMLLIETGDPAVKIRFVPSKTTRQSVAGQALGGDLEFTIEGEVTPETLQKVRQAMERFGISVDPPTPEYQELLYLHRTIYLRNDHTKQEYKKILKSKKPDGEKVKQVKAWVKQNYGIELPDQWGPDYNPAGFTNSFGEGIRHWDRWDLPRSMMEKEMKDYNLHHGTSRLEQFITGVLDGGGEITNTTARLRRGISLDATGGQSSHEDVATGGASYLFTRIVNTANGPKDPGIYLKIRVLSRDDVVSYDGDKWGRISKFDERNAKPEHYRRSAKTLNETNLKNGTFLLDEIQYIKAGNPTQRKTIIQAFKDRGIHTLPDGRKIEEVVI